MLSKSLTIVLPVHNAESRLRKKVGELLDLASELTAKFGVLIIDDGSTDSTFEVAEELAAHFPQVSVRRHRQCRGLGAAIEYVKRRVISDAIIMHDGVSPIDSNQVRKLWRRWVDQSNGKSSAAVADEPASDASDFAALPSLHAAMERAHRQLLGFQMITPQAAASIYDVEPGAELAWVMATGAKMEKSPGIGQIPALPRPKFLATIAKFAFGE